MDNINNINPALKLKKPFHAWFVISSVLYVLVINIAFIFGITAFVFNDTGSIIGYFMPIILPGLPLAVLILMMRFYLRGRYRIALILSFIVFIPLIYIFQTFSRT